MALSLKEYRRIRKEHGKDAADRANAAGSTDVATLRSPGRPAARGPVAVPRASGLSNIQDRFVRIAAAVQERLGHPPWKSHLEVICDRLHFGTNFFRTMAALEAADAIRREDDGDAVRYRVLRATPTNLFPDDQSVLDAAVRAPN